MKPRTKLQKKVMKLKHQIDPISEEDKQWANEALFKNYYVEVRNRYYCLECGHKWKSEEAELSYSIIAPTCPSCGAENLENIIDWSVDENKYEYWAIIDVMEGFQVVRMFMAHKYMKRKQPATYWHREVMQHWVRPDGKITSLTAQTNSLGFYNYVDSWASEISLEPRTPSRNHKIRCNIAPYKIRPGRKTLPTIRRNGYKGYFKGKAPHHFFSAILKYPKAETLLKSGQTSLFKKCVGLDDIHEDIEKYWHSICIAMRNDYIVKDAGDWLDYLSMLDEFGKDLRNQHYICPADFHKEHQRYVKKRRAKRKAEAEEKRRQRIKEAQEEYLKTKGKYFDLRMEYGEVKIIPMKSVEEVIELGDRLHHCLGLSYAKKEHSLILGAYLDEEPLEAIEVNIKKLEITQARGLQNLPTEHHETIVETVRENMGKIAAKANQKEVAA